MNARVENSEGLIQGRLKYLQQYLKTSHFEYGMTNIPGKSNEDTFDIYLHDEKSSAFGVYDGHGGSDAGRICADTFCRSIWESVDRFLAQIIDTRVEDDTFDAVFCESARKQTDKFSGDIKRTSKSGTTCITLFSKVLDDGRIKMFCVNTGDSRCIMIRNEEPMFLSEDHNLVLPREVERIMKRKAVIWYPLPANPDRLRQNLELRDKGSSHGDVPAGLYPTEDRMSEARKLITSLTAAQKSPKRVKPTAFSTAANAVKDQIRDLPADSISTIPIISMQALSSSTDNMDITIHNKPRAFLEGNTDLKGIVLEDRVDSSEDLSKAALPLSAVLEKSVIAVKDLIPASGNLDSSVHSNQSRNLDSSLHSSDMGGSTDFVTISRTLDIVKTLVDEAYRVLDAEKVSFWQPERNTDPTAKAQLKCIISEDIVGVTLNVDEGLVGRCYTTRSMLYGASAEKAISRAQGNDDRKIFSEAVNPRCRITIPLINPISDKVIGVLQLNNKTTGEPYTIQDVNQLSMMCQQTAQAIGNFKRSRSRNRGTGMAGSDNGSDTAGSTTEAAASAAREDAGAMLVFKNSFVAHRVSADGKTFGPKALFSRYNVSITMTRSIGDKYAARSCVSVPDITAITIGAGEYVRVVLASDGVWDVIPIESAAEMIRGVRDPRKASMKLSHKARIRREEAVMKIDDITCIVVDFNPENPQRQEMGAAEGCGCVVC